MTTAADGDRQRTFREEALPHLDAVYRFALRLTGADDLADDLTQDTFLRAYRSWDRYTLGTNARSWLFTICRNLFLRGEERNRRHDEIVSEVKDEDPRRISRESTVFMSVGDRDPEGAFWSQVVDEKVLEAIQELPPEFREAVILSDLEGLSYREMSEVMEVPEGTVKSRLYRGRQLLQESLYAYAVETGILRPDSPGEGAT